MPGIEAAQVRAVSGIGSVPAKVLYAIDASCAVTTHLTDLSALSGAATAAVAAGDGNVLDASHFVFPNGAITLVLILAESHLSIHTWPEEHLIAIDLFSCGAIDGQAVIDHLVRDLELSSVTVRELARGLL